MIHGFFHHQAMAFIQDAQLGDRAIDAFGPKMVGGLLSVFFRGKKPEVVFFLCVHKWMCKNMDLDGFGFPNVAW